MLRLHRAHGWDNGEVEPVWRERETRSVDMLMQREEERMCGFHQPVFMQIWDLHIIWNWQKIEIMPKYIKKEFDETDKFT